MNKDVVYIEPEDDITDIITKIENAKQKIVALVPPKKAGVFRSIVNIKLMAKAGNSADKTVVLVTTDPSIIKLAAATKLPVTKNLQSAPVIPEGNDEVEKTAESSETLKENLGEEDSEEELAEKATTDPEEFMAESESESDDESEAESDGDEKADDETESESEPDEDKPSGKRDKKSKKDEKSEKTDDKKSEKKPKSKWADSKNPFLRFVGTHRKLTIGCGIGAVVLILVLVWAFAIAPAATITVTLRTSTGNFSENVTFTEKLDEEDASKGKFYLDTKKIESKSEVEFEATGKKNMGEKATGSVVVYAYFDEKGTVSIDSGSIFTLGGLNFVSTAAGTLTWDGDGFDACDNKGNASSITKSGCQISTRINVEATESGSKYNVSASSTGWKTTANVGVYSDKAMAGGTDKTVTVVQQSDIDKALEQVQSANEAANKEKLLGTLSEGDFAIEASFSQTTGEPVSTPAIGGEVEEGKKAKLSVVTTDSIFVIDKTKVEEFIKEKARLSNNFKIYEMNDPFIENFTKTADSGYTGKLKTSYVSGLKITENDIIDTVKGKGLGVAQNDVKSAYGEGIHTMQINVSFPWVTSIPNDPNKITVILEVKE